MRKHAAFFIFEFLLRNEDHGGQFFLFVFYTYSLSDFLIKYMISCLMKNKLLIKAKIRLKSQIEKTN